MSTLNEPTPTLDDLGKVIREIGYNWPDDKEGRLRVMMLVAERTKYWREEVGKVRSECFREVERERLYKHQQARYLATVKKLKNTRKALREFMTSQVAFMRVAMVEMRESRPVKKSDQ